MSRRVALAWLAVLALVAGIGAWLRFGVGVYRGEPGWLIPLAALILAAGAMVHLGWIDRRRAARANELAAVQAARLKAAREAYQALWNNSDMLICTLDDQGRYISMNRCGLEMVGADQADIEGKFFEEHFDSDGAARLRDLFRTARTAGQAGANLEPLVLAGRERFVDLYLRAMTGPESGREVILVLVRDQTEQKLFRERMWQAEKLASLGLLAAGVAHQLNNPLGILMGFSQLLLESTPDEAPGRRELGIILEQGRECKRIVDGLLNFTRLSEAGAGGCDLLTGLRSVLETVRPVLKSKGVELVEDLPLDPLDPGHMGGVMQQVFLNLIANAVDAMPQGGRLEVSARAITKAPRQGNLHGTLPDSDSYVELVFRDTGPGVPPDIAERVFDPFFTTKPVGQGVGLGLSVAYGIVREQGGTITVDQPRPDDRVGSGGARFTVRLPLDRPGDQAADEDSI